MNSYYSYQMDPDTTFAGFAFAMVAVIYLVLFAYLIANYILRALGLYRIAKNNSIPNPWLAWIPYAYLFLLGKITGDVSLGSRRLKNTPLWLLLIPIIIFSIAFVFYVGLIIMVIIMEFGGFASESMMVMLYLMLMAFIIVLVPVKIFYDIIYGITYYTLCTKYKTAAHSVFYALMALFVPLAGAILLCRMSKMTPIASVNPYTGEESSASFPAEAE